MNLLAMIASALLMGNSQTLAPADGFSGQIVLGSRDHILINESYGFADRESSVPVSGDVLFDIGSLTKQVTAAGILLLVQQERLALDERLSSFFNDVPPELGEQTVHNVLTHTAGLPQYSGEDYDLIDRVGFDDWLSAADLSEARPGTFHYSNPGYSALARIIEIRTGLAFEDFVQDALFSAAGPFDIGYRDLPPGLPEATGYLNGEPVGRPREQAWLADGPSWNLRGNGGMLASAETLYRWTVALTGAQVLDADHAAMLFQPYVVRYDERQIFYGYGWNVLPISEPRRVYHSGGNGVFVAYVEWLPDADCFIVVTSNAFDAMDVGALVAQSREWLLSTPACAISR